MAALAQMLDQAKEVDHKVLTYLTPGVEYDPAEVICSFTQTYEESLVRESIWRLISDGSVTLTSNRKLVAQSASH